MEVLSLRQKIVLSRQAIHFLHRCLRQKIIPNFIKQKKLDETLGKARGDQRLQALELHILRMALRSKRDYMYTLLNKCNPATGGSGGDRDNQRVTLIGSVSLSEEALSLLDMGPSFSPSRSLCKTVTQKIVGNLQSLHDRLRQRARIDSRPEGFNTVSCCGIPPPPFPATYLGSQEPNPEMDSKFRIFADSLFALLRRNIGKRTCQKPHLGSESGISVSDKGGEFVVLSQAMDRAITRAHLQDRT
ncbi:hypothetical protein COOONC_17293, partial [Cooperia oncophora]